MRRAHWTALVTALVLGGLALPGCTKKKQDDAKPAGEAMQAAMDTPAPDMRPQPDMRPAPRRARPEPMRPGPAARPVDKPTGADGPPAGVAKALGSAPKMVLRANMASWMGTPLMKPLVAMIQGQLKKEYPSCAAKIDFTQAKKALYMQSAGRFIQRADAAAKTSHYMVVDTGMKLGELLQCGVKGGHFKKVKLNGGVAFQPANKDKKSWWFAANATTLVVVDGAWAAKVKPGHDLLGSGKLLEQVGGEAIRAWVVDFAPDILAVIAFLKLGATVVGRAVVTWRDQKDAVAMTKLKEKMAKRKPELAKLMAPITITAQGNVSTFAFRASAAEATKLGMLVQMFFLRGGSAVKKVKVAPTARKKVTVAPKPK